MSVSEFRRRDFIKTATAAAGLGLFTPVRKAFAAHITASTHTPDRNWQAMKSEYMLSPHLTYFNHGSIGTMPRVLHEAHKKYLALCETNPWLYTWSEPWDAARAEVRKKAAAYINADDDEIAITHNTTEGFNILANGLPLGKGDEALFSSLNHSGASVCWFHNAQAKGFTVRRFTFPIQDVKNFSKEEMIDVYVREISPKTRVLVMPHIDNSVGIRYPIKEIADAARSKGVEWIAVDGAQSVGMIPVNMRELGVDFYSTSPHKWLQTPKGLGLFYLRKEVQEDVRPMWVTWGQRRWQKSARRFEDYGTRNLAEVLTLGDALDFHEKLGQTEKEQRLLTLRKYIMEKAEARNDVVWHSPKTDDLATSIYSLECKGKNSAELSRWLYEVHGYILRPFSGESFNALRLSPNYFNLEDEADRFFELLS